MVNTHIIRPITKESKVYGVFFILNVNEIDITGKKKPKQLKLMETIGKQRMLIDYLRKEFL